MKTSTRILLSSVMSILLAVPSTAFAQSRSAARPAQPARSATSKPSQPASRPSNNSSSSSSRQTVKNVNPQPAKSTVTPAKPSGNKASQSSLSSGTRSSGASNAQPAPVRPSGTVNSPAKPAATPAKPAGSNATPSRPAATPAKPAGSTTAPKPSGTTTAPKPSGSTTAPSRPPGNSSTGNSESSSNPSFNGGGRQPQQPGKPNAAPSNPGNKPGSSPSMNNRPGGNSASRPGATVKPQPNRPAPPPYRPSVSRPHYNYAAPGYRPPRPNGGYWGAPPVNIYRPVFYRPVPPPRPAVISYVYPSVTSILGLAFGSFLDAGINALYTAGYNVLGYADNMVYLSNVSQLGYIWPEATVYYTDGLMSNTQFQYWTTYYDTNRFNSVYNLLTNTYGYPVNNYTENGIRYVNWWAGGDTAYITLQYGPGLGNNGRTTYYYTTLTYSDYY